MQPMQYAYIYIYIYVNTLCVNTEFQCWTHKYIIPTTIRLLYYYITIRIPIELLGCIQVFINYSVVLSKNSDKNVNNLFQYVRNKQIYVILCNTIDNLNEIKK